MQNVLVTGRTEIYDIDIIGEIKGLESNNKALVNGIKDLEVKRNEALNRELINTDGTVETLGSILVNIDQKLPPETRKLGEVTARKHSCKSVWCSQCYRRYHLQRHYDRLSGFEWDKTRFVTLTIDRDIVEGADAFMAVREGKLLGRFIQRLKRHGIILSDWAGQLEFHRDGTPHYHLLIQTDKGKKGMIGGNILRSCWQMGRVHEEFFESKNHWDNIVGYFGKAGYFHKGKAYQTELPEYFKSDYFKGKKVMRFYSARICNHNDSENDKKKETKKKRTSKVFLIIQKCGQYTDIMSISYDEKNNIFMNKFIMKLSIPYNEFIKKVPGSYIKNRGFNLYLNGDDYPPF